MKKFNKITATILMFAMVFCISVPMSATAVTNPGNNAAGDYICNHNYHGEDYDCGTPNLSIPALFDMPHENETYVCSHNYHGEDYDCENKIPSGTLHTDIDNHQPLSAQEVAELLAKYEGICRKAPSDEEINEIIAKAAEAGTLPLELENSLKDIKNNTFETTGDLDREQLLAGGACDHIFWATGCAGDHVKRNGCTVSCYQLGICVFVTACKTTSTVLVTESEHTWSTGWCGQTCTECGVIEVFHAPGGCWYCS